MLSQTVEYALRAMVFIADQPRDHRASSESISRRTRVPRDYLSKIMRGLVMAGLLKSQRGPHGGFVLARAPREISMLDVVNAVDPIERLHECPLGNPDHLSLCPLHRRLDDAVAAVEQCLKTTTLADMVQSTGSTRECQGVRSRVALTHDRTHATTTRRRTSKPTNG